MQANLSILSLATLLCAAAPLCTEADPVSQPPAQDLERTVRHAAGTAVEKKAAEVAERLRGGSGSTDEDEDAEEDDSSEGGDPVLLRLTGIEERLCSIEALLAEIATRSGASSPAAASPNPPAIAAPTVTGAAVSQGFAKARFRAHLNHKDATVKLSINGMPAGRFDSDTYFDLGPFLKSGLANQIAFSIEPHGKSDPTGIDVQIDGAMSANDDYVGLLQFKATKERLADTFELPWAPR